MSFFDSHAHLSAPEVLPEIDAVMERAEKAQVTHIVNICTDAATLVEGLKLQERYPQIKNAGATTPHDVEKEGKENFPLFARLAQERKLVAVGETGLEYFYRELDREVQKQFLVRYLHLAQECQLPVIFHCREAFSDLFAITDAEYARGAPAILHCFAGSLKEAEGVLERGWYLSLSGIVTYKKNEVLREVAQLVPLDRLLLETDTPYLAPQSHRGRPNEPSFLPETALCIAKVKGISLEEVATATSANASRVFER